MKISDFNSTLSCISICIESLRTMINKKIIFVLFIFSFFGACTSPTAMLGPAYSLSSSGSVYQALGGCLFHILIVIFFTEPYIDFTKTFFIAMSHQIFLVSFGAFTILMFLIKKNSASKTVSIFFLIPTTSAFMAWIFLNEKLTNIDLIGFLITSIGVYIATRD